MLAEMKRLEDWKRRPREDWELTKAQREAKVLKFLSNKRVQGRKDIGTNINPVAFS